MSYRPSSTRLRHDDSRQQPEAHLGDFINACNYAGRLKTLWGPTPYKFICKGWSEQPDLEMRPASIRAGE